MASDAMVMWLVRAGDSVWQQEHRLQGRADLPLSPQGRAMIMSDVAQRHVSAADRVATVHHAPDEGAAESAAIVAGALGAKPRPSDDLADPDLGLLGGLTIALFEERFPTRFRQWEDDPLSLVPPEGEPLAAARERVLREVARLARRTRGRALGLVLHPMALGFVRCALAGRPPGDLWRVLDGRPRLERYLLPADAGDRMEAAVGGQ
ncbi:MAG: histidine phosphatase family protein [Phycisphaerales bacterium]